MLSFLSKMSASNFVRPCEIVGGSVGQHTRHLNDHFVRLLDVLEHDRRAHAHLKAGGHHEVSNVVAYDERVRATDFETNVELARDGIEITLEDMISVVDSADLDADICVSFTLAGRQQQFQSTVGREFAFVLHHAFHHAASIRSIANHHSFGHLCPPEFGVAPSTLQHRSQGQRDK